MHHVVYNVVTYLHLVIEKCNVTGNLKNEDLDDLELSF